MNEIEAISVLETRIKYPNSDTYGGMCEAEYQQEAVVLAIEALREQAEREKGCEYCQKPYKSIDSGKDGKEKSILYMGGSSPYVKYCKKYLHFMDVAGRMDLFEVKYCPMCGRRLEVERDGR